MLESAVAAFLDTVSEREFDEPLLALLRGLGYSDVQLTHGPQEFGKDAIAKHDGEQWVFQSKAGNVSHSDWRKICGQLDELRTSNLAGPGFDREFPRRPVLVITGRLTGNANLSATDYNERAATKNEPPLEIWDRDKLTELLLGQPSAPLRVKADGDLYQLVGKALNREPLSMDDIENFSQRWNSWTASEILGFGVVEAAFVGTLLREAGRVDLACHVSLCLLRAGWAAEPAATASRPTSAEAAIAMFTVHAEEIWSTCQPSNSVEDAVLEMSPGSWASYPVRCARVGEILGLLYLAKESEDDPGVAELGQWLARLATEPGAARLMSDKYAVSLVPLVAAIRTGGGEVDELLKKTALWLCDVYATGELGLAAPDASVAEEVQRAFGGALESVDLTRRSESYAASLVLDLLLLMKSDLYADVRNDFLAVGITAQIVRTEDDRDQFLADGGSVRIELNPSYPDELSGAIPSHLRNGSDHSLVKAGASWDLLAISSVLRDRWFAASLVEVIA